MQRALSRLAGFSPFIDLRIFLPGIFSFFCFATPDVSNSLTLFRQTACSERMCRFSQPRNSQKKTMKRDDNSRLMRAFPKSRPPLPKEIEDVYATHYKSNREGDTTAASLAQRMEAWMHRKVAADLNAGAGLRRSTLEIGAGTLNQLKYEPDVGPYDIIEPFASLYQNSPSLSRIRRVYGDIAEIDPALRYDRITSVATFEHILNLPEVVARAGLLLAPDGVMRVAIPSEGTPLWTLGWKLTTGLEFKLKYGLDYGLLMKHEHVNTAAEIRDVLQFCFRDIQCSVFGVARSVSFYQYYECRAPRLNHCEQFVAPSGR
jgi:hypothetical protein